MTSEFIVNEGFKRLILIFAGWGMDARPFMNLKKRGYDILLIYDYTGYNDDNEVDSTLLKILTQYDETVVFAWSFGVRVASTLLPRLSDTLAVTRRVAVNGTPTHIHDLRGIPSATFRGTLSGFSEISVRKFHRRMFSTAADFAVFTENSPHRSFDSLKSELETFGALPPVDGRSVWDIAVVSDDDRIFPAGNQMRGWEGCETFVMENAPHFPDMQQLIDRFVVDKQLVASKFAGAAKTYASHAPVQTAVATQLWERTKPFIREMKTASALRVLEIGVGDGTLTRLYSSDLQNADITLWDIADVEAPVGTPTSARLKVCDAETAIDSEPDERYDIILSASTMQWFHSPSRFIRHMRKTLASGGIAAIALYGKGTFSEIEEATGRTLSYPTLRQLRETATVIGFTELYAAEESSTISFPSVAQLLWHLKFTGVNSVGNEAQASRDALRMMRHYPTSPEGEAPLTYHTLYLILRKD